MVKIFKPVIIILFCTFCTSATFGQKQASFVDLITAKFIDYCKSVPWEEIFIHTDRNVYISGEDLWFNIYLIDRQSTKPSPYSKIAYFEILNQNNQPVVRKRIKVENGFGPGQVILPDSLSTGSYTLRAYTNWMKNFLPVNCFLKKINIYNSFDTRNSGIKTSFGNMPQEDIENQNNIKSYKGFSLDISGSGSDEIDISINADDNFRSLYGNIYYLFIHTHGVINYTTYIRLTGDKTSIIVPGKEMIPGINQVTIFSQEGKPLIDRFIYTPPKENNAQIVIPSGTWKSRNKISLEIDVDKEFASTFDKGNMSISIAPVTNMNDCQDLANYMVFGSEFGILPDEIRNNRISEIPPETLDKFLLTLKSSWINWEEILAEKLPVQKYKVENENHYLPGKLINRSTQLPDTGKFVFLSVPGKIPVFSYSRTDESGNFSFSIPIGDGVNDLVIQPEEVNKNNIVKIESPFSEEFLPVVNIPDSANLKIPGEISKLGVNYQVGKIYESSCVGSPLSESNKLPAAKRFYGKPDIELIMDDYIQLPIMEEVFYELLPGVYLKKRKSVYEISVLDPVDERVYNTPPVLFIDGVRVADASLIANLDPVIVEKIDAVKEVYLVGDFMIFGLVNVITRKGDFSSVTLPDYAIRLNYRVTEPVNLFSPPDYQTDEKRKSRVPDFRNTLYWNPAFKTNNDGKAIIEFWTSDYATDYEINIQGLSADGKAICINKTIKIE